MSTNVRNLDNIAWESGPDRKLAHNTYRVSGDGWVGVRYHGTVIIRTDHTPEDGMGYRLSSGGYRTSTTKQRIGALLPGRMTVWQKNFEWFVSTSEGDIPFEDGMRVAW